MSNKSAYVIRDEMDPVRHPADGKIYTSKRAFRKTTRAAGCEEVGNEKLERRKKESDASGHDIKRAIEELRGR